MRNAALIFAVPMVIALSLRATGAAALGTSDAAAAHQYVSPWRTPWTYEGERGNDHWADLDPQYAACRGREQSPIDIRETQKLLPKDAIFTIDSGTHFLFAVQYLETVQPDSFIVMTGLGSMGQSIGAAIGAQLANPTRTVAAICETCGNTRRMSRTVDNARSSSSDASRFRSRSSSTLE